MTGASDGLMANTSFPFLSAHTSGRAKSHVGSLFIGDNMRQLLAVLLCLAVPFSVFAAESGYMVTYDGGSLPDIKAGTGIHMFIGQDNV
jgi:hypothetical protein